MPRTSPCLTVTPEDRVKLETVIRCHTSEQREVLRANIVLGCAQQHRVDELASKLHVSKRIVAKWRDRYREYGLEGLSDKPRSGRKPIYGDTERNAILQKLDETPPDGLARWDAPILAKELGISVHAIWRILKKEGIHLCRQRSWCVSTDPEFVSKAADIVGLYLNPPENAIVICIDEKPSIQALTRQNGYVFDKNGDIIRGIKNTYRRNGTINLFSALQVATGLVTGKFTQTKTRVDFLAFMDDLLEELRKDENITYHVILDNYCVHKRCDEWLEKHPNVKFHYTPTSASWLNQVE